MEILKYPSEALRKPCTSISEPESTLTALEQALTGKSGEYIGLGLSANQIGLPDRVCIIRYQNWKTLNLVNPRIIKFFGPLEMKEEGCLSFPGLFKMVPRFPRILLKGDNFGGEIYMNNPEIAHIIQHEINHLDAVLLSDHKKPGRNDPCLCGSGKKMKKCCGVNL